MESLLSTRHDADSTASTTFVSSVNRLAASERARFEAAYCEHRAAVTHLLSRRIGCEAEVADLVQEVYLRILRYRDCGPESLKLLLFRTALNLATSHVIRTHVRLPHLPLEDVEIATDMPSLEEEAESQQRIGRMMAVVDTLPGRCRQVFLLRLIHGLRQREIAERCGISIRRVEQHLARAQALIRERVACHRL